MDRAIIHLNVADFAVAVERAIDRRLAGRPVVIAPSGTTRAIVYDMSEEAYRAGVRKGMALARAARLCRDACVLPPRPERYEQAMAALLQCAVPYSPRIEAGDGDGHLFVDATGTGRLFGPPVDVAWRLRREIRTGLCLAPIWSVAPNKLTAKVASRLVKPEGEYIVAAGEEQAFLAPLGLELIPGIEHEDLIRLREFNLTRVHEVIALQLEELQAPFGRRAMFLYEAVRGIDPSPVLAAGEKPPAIKGGHTFATDTNDTGALLAALYRLVEQAGDELRRRRRTAQRIAVVLDYSDGVRCIRSAAARPATANDIFLFETARRVLFLAWTRRVRVRHLGLVCDRLVFPPAQLALFGDARRHVEKSERLIGAIDAVRHRFGRDAIAIGRTTSAASATIRSKEKTMLDTGCSILDKSKHTCGRAVSSLDGQSRTPRFHLSSSIEHRASSIQYPASSIQYRLMTPLIVHSHYSLMWGTASPRRICRAARQMGYERLALTDTDNLYGLWPFLSACRHEGIKPIVGAEVTDPGSGRQAVCLVETDEGYHNLCRLLTRRHLEAETFDLENDLVARAEGLTVLTVDPELLVAWHEAGVTAAAAMPRRTLLATHPLRSAARRLGVPALAAPGSFFLQPEDAAVHRLLRAIARNTSVSRLAAGDTAPPDAWLARPEEYERRFLPCPEALRAAAALAERLTFTGPAFGTVLPPHDGKNSQSAVQQLRVDAYLGARRRYGEELSEAVVERLEHELRLIGQMGFGAYFLIVRDIVALSPRTCGRGSGAASLVAYCLGITNVCPLKYNLYFERFLNPGRTDPPDIDVDFAWDERDAVLATVLVRHRGHTAMVANHVLFQPRMAVREVAKVYGLTEDEIGRVSRRLPGYWRAEETHADFLAELKSAAGGAETKALDFPPPWPEILAYARRLVGIPRHLSVHPGGVVITPRPIDEYVPLERAPKGVPIIQWEKDAAEDAGLVKIDLLGNRSLGVIRDALANLRANGTAFDESRWEPEDDFATQQAVAQGRTMGCFYIESPAMRLLLQKSRVGDFEHLVIHSSIIRPAANDYIREYIRRLHGGAWKPIHPLLADVLEETFGIMVYQEDVSRAAVALAGFSHAEADGLRKILSKKDRELQLADYARRFREGARAKGVADEAITAVWDMMMSFDGYSFCKPHSASYARVSFQAAYLKTHHPAEFMAAVISNQGGFYSAFAYVSEARRLGLKVLPPEVNASEVRWTGKQDALRIGLLSIKDLTAATQERIVAGRKDRAYAGLRDFLERVRPDTAEVRTLVHCGALDGLAPGASRAELLWEATRRLSALSSRGRTAPCSRSLFATSQTEEHLPRLPPDDPRERMRREFAALGFLCDRHPMELYASAVHRAGAVKAVDVPQRVGRRVRFAGWLITGKVVETKHSEPMEFLTFEDETGLVETTFFPETYRRFCHLLDRERPYLLAGKVEEDWGAVTLTVETASALTTPAGTDPPGAD